MTLMRRYSRMAHFLLCSLKPAHMRPEALPCRVPNPSRLRLGGSFG